MNPFEMIVAAIAGVLVLIFLKEFLFMIISERGTEADRIDLQNIIDIYREGLLLNSSFNISYKLSHGGVLNITSGKVRLNNVSCANPGFSEINCTYDSIKISEEGLECLKS